MSIYYFFVGGCKVSSDRINAEAIINICMKYGIFYKNFMISEDGLFVQLTCSLYASRILRDVCSDNGIDISIKESYGIPHLLKKYNKRYGLLLGGIVALTIIWLSCQYIWDVRVSGDDLVDENIVIDCLKDNGLFVGSRIRDLDIDAIENKVLIDFDEISWIAVNMKGSVAYVEIREKLISHEDIEGRSPANIIAKYDGQIEAIEARSGEPQIVLGQYVSKGDLLISGIYDSVPLGYRYIRAKGDVWAKTVHTLNVEIPFEYYEKVYIGEHVVENNIIFFSKRIKLFENTGFLGATYDTIYKMSNLSLPGEVDLPLAMRKTVHMYYEYQHKIRTAEEAVTLAYDELDILIANILEDGAEVLRKNITYDTDSSSVKLECTLVLKENIAETMEFEVDR